MKASSIVLVTVAVTMFVIPAVPAAPEHACGADVYSIGGFYLADDGTDVSSASFSVWLYEETTGDANLQRGGRTATLGDQERCEMPEELGAHDTGLA